MPLYDLKCTVRRDGKSLRGRGVELPASVGDRLIAHKLATLSEVAPAPEKKPKPGPKPSTAPEPEQAPAPAPEKVPEGKKAGK